MLETLISAFVGLLKMLLAIYIIMTTKSAMDLVYDAKRQFGNLTPDVVQREMAEGNVTLIELRKSEELQENGKIAGSTHAPRGLLEFYADAACPVYKPEFVKNNRLILYCSRGFRSALASDIARNGLYECGSFGWWV